MKPINICTSGGKITSNSWKSHVKVVCQVRYFRFVESEWNEWSTVWIFANKFFNRKIIY